MASGEVAPPVAAPRIRSEWIERFGGQMLALVASLAIALAIVCSAFIGSGASVPRRGP